MKPKKSRRKQKIVNKTEKKKVIQRNQTAQTIHIFRKFVQKSYLYLRLYPKL